MSLKKDRHKGGIDVPIMIRSSAAMNLGIGSVNILRTECHDPFERPVCDEARSSQQAEERQENVRGSVSSCCATGPGVRSTPLSGRHTVRTCWKPKQVMANLASIYLGVTTFTDHALPGDVHSMTASRSTNHAGNRMSQT